MARPTTYTTALLLIMSATLVAATAVCARAANPPEPSSASPNLTPAEPPAMLDLGGFDVFEIHSSLGSLSPQDRVDQITSRIAPLLGVPSIPPDAVRIYNPKGGNPSIYVLGRRIVTIDPESAKIENNETQLQLATSWAMKLQQVLPQVNYRLPGQPLPNPNPHSNVIVTDQLADVGGSVGEVYIGRKLVMRLRGVQPDGLTAAERADMIRVRLYTAIRTANSAPASNPALSSDTAPTASSAPSAAGGASPSAPASAYTEASKSDSTPVQAPAAPSAAATPDLAPSTGSASTQPAPLVVDPVQVAPVNPALKTADAPEQLVVDGTPIIAVDQQQAVADGQPNPLDLVSSWAKNIRAALAPEPAAPPVAANDSAAAGTRSSPATPRQSGATAAAPSASSGPSAVPAANAPELASGRDNSLGTPQSSVVPAPAQ